MKAYIASSSENGTDNIDGAYFLITEEGEVLATHLCSHKLYALGDLYAHRKERIKNFEDRFGDFSVDYLGNDEMTWEELLRRNKKFYEKDLEEESL